MQSDDSSDDEFMARNLGFGKRAKRNPRNEGTYAPRTMSVLVVVETWVCMIDRIWKTKQILKEPRTCTASTDDSENRQVTDEHSAEGRPDDDEIEGHTGQTRVPTDIGEIMPPRKESLTSDLVY